MTFGKLAQYLEQLEGMSSRLEMTRMLAELFKEVEPEEAKIVTYLCQGMLGPKYANPDTGMAEKQVMKALNILKSPKTLKAQDAEKIFKETGDLGKTIEQIKKQNAKSKDIYKNLEISEVFNELINITQASGTGSQEEKIKLLGDLLNKLNPIEAKYAIKIVLGKMRGGFSDMTVLDSLSWMLTGDKSLREEIERIYNVRADLGLVVETLKALKTLKTLKSLRVSPEIGTPVLVAKGEREKSIKDIWERMTGPSTGSGRQQAVAAEHKLDGLRIQAHVNKHQALITNNQTNSNNQFIKLFSRGMEDVTNMYPDIAEGLRKQVKQDCILDGEMIAVDENGKYRPFQETVQRKRKYDISQMAVKVPLQYFVFDVLYAEGKNFLDRPNEERWEKLEEIVNNTPSNPPLNLRGGRDVVCLIPRKIVKSEEEMEEFFKEAVAEGTEGMFIKRLDGVYKSGSRDFNWIKFKKSYGDSTMADTIDAVVMGYDRGEGKRSGFGIGGFLIGVYDAKQEKYLTIAKIGTGLKDEEWKKLQVEGDKLKVESKPENYEVSKQMECDVWVRPKIVVEVKADEITKSPMHTSGLALRFPRLVSFREKKPEDATTYTELKNLFIIQNK